MLPRVEIDTFRVGFFVSQKKYTLDLLKEYGLIGAKPLQLPMDLNLKLTTEKKVSPFPHQLLIRGS